MQGLAVIKIFTKEAGFQAESLVYNNSFVSAAVGTGPELSDNSDRAATCQFTGFVFPPFSVSEQVESLEGWLQQRGSPQLGTAVKVLAHIHCVT